MPHRDAQIIIVDDNPANVTLLESILEEEGYDRLVGVTDSRRVADTLEQQTPDLILLDIRMPHLDGYDILRLIQDRFPDLAPPVMVLTAQTDGLTRSRALELGALDVINKPFDQTEVLQRIENILAKHYQSKSHRDQALELERLVEERTRELRQRSLQDPLTDLPNRRAILLDLVERLGEDQPVAVFFIVIDHLDDIAGLNGYPVAESLFRQLGEALTHSAVARGGTIGVWGSNEFILAKEHAANGEKIAASAWRILRLLAGEHRIDGLSLHVEARIGASHSGDDHENAEELLRHAALALPRLGSDERYRGYDPALRQALEQRGRLQRALKNACANDELHLVYQPKIALGSGRTVGAEALLRWESPELGRVSPGEFIPLAEETGDILELSEWVLETGLEQIRQWLDNDEVSDDFSLALNVSSRQLMQPDFARLLIEKVKTHRVPPGMVQVEVTESGLMDDINQARQHLINLNAAGIQSAIDDFGTGYSSLAYLRGLPVSVLKIDRSFVNDIETNGQDLRLAETVVTMAHNFGCIVVAEGVENAEQARLLAGIGCEHVQGYHYARPMDAGALAGFVDDRN